MIQKKNLENSYREIFFFATFSEILSFLNIKISSVLYILLSIYIICNMDKDYLKENKDTTLTQDIYRK